jgi:hypothetical protein
VFWSAMLTLGGLDTVLRLLRNLSYTEYACGPTFILVSLMEAASFQASFFLPEILIRRVLP